MGVAAIWITRLGRLNRTNHNTHTWSDSFQKVRSEESIRETESQKPVTTVQCAPESLMPCQHMMKGSTGESIFSTATPHVRVGEGVMQRITESGSELGSRYPSRDVQRPEGVSRMMLLFLDVRRTERRSNTSDWRESRSLASCCSPRLPVNLSRNGDNWFAHDSFAHRLLRNLIWSV